MNEKPRLSPKPSLEQTHKPSSSPSSSSSAVLENLPRKHVEVRLVSENHLNDCLFWIGLTKQGTHSPYDLLKTEALNQLFDIAATDGIKETEPILLADTFHNPARFLYLFPDFSLLPTNWLEKLVQSAEALKPQSVGLYLSPLVIPFEKALSTLREILKNLIIQTSCLDYYLYTGSYGTNPVLNSTLDMKAFLEKQHIDMLVFH